MNPDAAASTNGTPAPYGRACTNCARAKCRCIYRTGGPDCERCHRLKKECIPSVSVRKRNGKRAHVSRAAQLEAKLEDLVTLLRHQTGPADNMKPLSPANTAGSLSVGTPAASGLSNSSHSAESPPELGIHAALPPQKPNCKPGRLQPAPVSCGSLLGTLFHSPETTRSTTTPPPPPAPPPPDPVELDPIAACIYQPTPREAEESLAIFRKFMLIFLPFVYLPDTMTSERLKEAYPFLWFNIMTVTCRHVDRRLVMSAAIKRFLANKLILDHEKSLDLLLGILVILGWTHYHFKKDKPLLSVLASLAKSLIYDLGLNKVPTEPYITACFKSVAPHSRELKALDCQRPPREKTNDERRAVLACFYLTSQISHSLKRMDALTWTPHMEEFLQTLSQKPEWEGDELLVAQVKIQLTLEQLTRAISQSADGVLPAYYLSALRTQLQTIEAQLPNHLQQNDTVLGHKSYTDLVIQEAGLAKPRFPTTTTTTTLNAGIPDLQRYEAMEGCLNAVKEWFDRHFSIPSYVYEGMTFSYWCHMAHCLLSLYRLSVLDDPAWDLRAVRAKIDLLDVCDRLKAGFEQVVEQRLREAGSSVVEEDGFAKFAKMLLAIRNSWGAEMAAAEKKYMPGAATAMAGDAPVTGNEPFLDGMGGMPLFQNEDESWIAGIFDMNWDFS